MTLLQKVDSKDVEIGHVRDEENPSDFLTKWVPKAKMESSVRFATNSDNVVVRSVTFAYKTKKEGEPKTVKKRRSYDGVEKRRCYDGVK